MGIAMQSAMVALTLNKPYNFSNYVFTSMKDNLLIRPQKFLMYPRFVQMLLNRLAPNLQTDVAPISLQKMHKRI